MAVMGIQRAHLLAVRIHEGYLEMNAREIRMRRAMSQGDASRPRTWRKMVERQRSFGCIEGAESREQAGNGRETRKGKGPSFTISHPNTFPRHLSIYYV